MERDDDVARNNLLYLERFQEAKSLLRRTLPVARRVHGESSEVALRMRSNYGMALYTDDDATLDDLREAVATIEETEKIAWRVLGGAHPTVSMMETNLRHARATLRARETPPPPDTA
jgi:hypothetical protein